MSLIIQKLFIDTKPIFFYSIRFEVQPQVRKILRTMSQEPPLPEVRVTSVEQLSLAEFSGE